MKLCLILVWAAFLSTEAKTRHRVVGLILCSDTEREVMYGDNEEEMYHIDFSKGKGVMTLPRFSEPISYPIAYESSMGRMEVCKSSLKIWTKNYSNPEPLDAPQSSIYSKNEVEVGFENTLICYITGFYPPHVKVSWTRNNVNVTDEVSLSRYYPTNDGSFNVVSFLKFIPEKGDIYTCTVEHTALDRPLTRTWDVQVTLPSVGLSVYCGVGLTAGMMGVAVGVFFFIKGNNCK
ncbi:H-2 class II histocompatibility antigen, A-Q alpha chain-like [Colossoma macropomum]|uniref:H-2 class II histocompatibility antigen, A-Q alpha chain-like n=1 Tax=Colossoma macropomum TaxID=42526 RepID=UPI00186486F2|nr:H-2 class II histocompatibility antigen, A-Q alpha chain-like [Colossoma macropomum]